MEFSKKKMTKVVDMVFMRVDAFLRSQNSFMRTWWLVERFQRAEVEGEGNQAAVLHGPDEERPFSRSLAFSSLTSCICIWAGAQHRNILDFFFGFQVLRVHRLDLHTIWLRHLSTGWSQAWVSWPGYLGSCPLLPFLAHMVFFPEPCDN